MCTRFDSGLSTVGLCAVACRSSAVQILTAELLCPAGDFADALVQVPQRRRPLRLQLLQIRRCAPLDFQPPHALSTLGLRHGVCLSVRSVQYRICPLCCSLCKCAHAHNPNFSALHCSSNSLRAEVTSQRTPLHFRSSVPVCCS